MDQFDLAVSSFICGLFYKMYITEVDSRMRVQIPAADPWIFSSSIIWNLYFNRCFQVERLRLPVEITLLGGNSIRFHTLGKLELWPPLLMTFIISALFRKCAIIAQSFICWLINWLSVCTFSIYFLHQYRSGMEKVKEEAAMVKKRYS